jgi:hypothetical protein
MQTFPPGKGEVTYTLPKKLASTVGETVLQSSHSLSGNVQKAQSDRKALILCNMFSNMHH